MNVPRWFRCVPRDKERISPSLQYCRRLTEKDSVFFDGSLTWLVLDRKTAHEQFELLETCNPKKNDTLERQYQWRQKC